MLELDLELKLKLDLVLDLELLELDQGMQKGKYHCTIDLLLDWFRKSVLQIKTKIVSCHRADSKSVKQEVNGTVILPPF